MVFCDTPRVLHSVLALINSPTGPMKWSLSILILTVDITRIVVNKKLRNLQVAIPVVTQTKRHSNMDYQTLYEHTMTLYYCSANDNENNEQGNNASLVPRPSSSLARKHIMRNSVDAPKRGKVWSILCHNYDVTRTWFGLTWSWFGLPRRRGNFNVQTVYLVETVALQRIDLI